MAEVLHDDDPTREGNLTAAEWAASYDDPAAGPHPSAPADVVAAAVAELDRMAP